MYCLSLLRNQIIRKKRENLVILYLVYDSSANQITAFTSVYVNKDRLSLTMMHHDLFIIKYKVSDPHFLLFSEGFNFILRGEMFGKLNKNSQCERGRFMCRFYLLNSTRSAQQSQRSLL